jgi:hypothetical protein
MEQISGKSTNHLLVAGFVAAGVLLSGLVFAGWLRFASDIVLTFAENGLSSCL